MSKQGRFQRQSAVRASGKAKTTKTIIIAVCVVLALILALLIGAVIYANSKLNKITQAEYATNPTEEFMETYGYFDETEETQTEATTEEPETEPTEPDYGTTGKIVNILLIGQDSREGEDSKLADTIMLCTINKETKVATLTSFLRDMFIKMPNYVEPNGKKHNCGRNRINANYAMGYLWAGNLGAMEMLDQCLELNFGIQVDGNVEVSFEAFITVVDQLGGVDVVLDEDEAAYMTTCYDNYEIDQDFYPGETHLDGFASLVYARCRHASPADNDINRANRQRNVIKCLLEKVRNMSLLEMNSIVDMVLPMVISDIEKPQIATYVMEMVPLLPFLTIESNQCPAEGTYHGEYIDIFKDGFMHGVLVPDVQKNRELLMALCEAD